MKILYLANIRLPSDKAEPLQVMKMCSAFAAAKARGLTLNQNKYDSGQAHIKPSFAKALAGKRGQTQTQGDNINVELVVPRRRNSQFKNVDPYEYYNVDKNFKITRLPTIDLMPWQKIFGHFAFKLSYWIFARVASLYARLVDSDIIYSRDWRTLNLLRRSRKNLIFELHEFRAKHAWAYQAIEPSCLKIIVISNGLKKKLLEISLQENKILVAPDAVDINEFNFPLTPPKAREKLNLVQDKKLIIYTGHLYKWKGIDNLINSFKIAREKVKDIKLILVGGQEVDVQRIKEYILENNISNIQVTGHRPYYEIPLYLKAADLLIIGDTAKADISREYTSPLKLFQYMAAKRPIIAPATPALKEILNDENSILFEPDNILNLASNIIYTLNNNNLTKLKIAKAWEKVQEYTWKRRVEKIINNFN